MKIKIRKARLADIPALRELWKQFVDFHFHATGDMRFKRMPNAHLRFGRFVARMIYDSTSLVLVAEEAGRILGYLTATVDKYPPVYIVKHYGAIYDLMVVPSSRRKGIGRKLFLQAKQWFRKKRMKRIEISVAVSNPLAMRFWKKIGFRTYMERMCLK